MSFFSPSASSKWDSKAMTSYPQLPCKICCKKFFSLPFGQSSFLVPSSRGLLLGAKSSLSFENDQMNAKSSPSFSQSQIVSTIHKLQQRFHSPQYRNILLPPNLKRKKLAHPQDCSSLHCGVLGKNVSMLDIGKGLGTYCKALLGPSHGRSQSQL